MGNCSDYEIVPDKASVSANQSASMEHNIETQDYSRIIYLQKTFDIKTKGICYSERIANRRPGTKV